MSQVCAQCRLDILEDVVIVQGNSADQVFFCRFVRKLAIGAWRKSSQASLGSVSHRFDGSAT